MDRFGVSRAGDAISRDDEEGSTTERWSEASAVEVVGVVARYVVVAENCARRD
jgi:hypothetical protein